MNVQGIGVPFKEQVRFESIRSKKGKNKSLYLHYMELERDCSNRVSNYHFELENRLLGLSRSKTEFIKKQNIIQRKKDLIRKERCKGNSDSADYSGDSSSPRYPGEKRVRFPPVISRSLTTLDVEQHYEVIKDTEKNEDDESDEDVAETLAEVDFFDRIPAKLYDDSKKPVNKRLADEAEKILKLDHTRVYIERSNSIFMGMPEGSVDERGISKRLIVPGLLSRWKRNALQPDKRRKKPKLLKSRSFSRTNSNPILKVPDTKDTVPKPTEKKVPFHLRMLMPINEEGHHENTDTDSSHTKLNPLITKMPGFSSSDKGDTEGQERPRDVRPGAARANSRERVGLPDSDIKAIEAVMKETEITGKS